MKTVLTLAFAFTSILSFSQTDIIEMRSRNASLKKYERLSKSDHVPSNFGMAPLPEVKTAVLDSVKIISDGVAIMYTSNYCTLGSSPRLEANQGRVIIDSNGIVRQIENPKRTYPNPRVGHLWQPGADTVVNHPLFRHQNSLDSIKEVLDRDYYFNLPADSIRFIGFDNGEGQAHRNEDAVQPVKHKREKKNAIGWELIFMLVTPILFMYAMSRFVIPRTSNSN